MSYYPRESLRISGVLYLLKRETGINIFEQEIFSVNNDILLDLIENKKVPDFLELRFKSYWLKNKEENTRYHEGVFYELCVNLLNKKISRSVFLSKIKHLLDKECDHISHVDYSKTTSQFKFPLSEEDYNVMINYHENFLSFLDFKSEDFYEGVFITGFPGIGKSLAAFSLLEKNIIEGGGGIFFSLDINDTKKTYSLMKSLNREDDLMCFTIHDYKDLFKKDLESIVKNNKVIVCTIVDGFFSGSQWLLQDFIFDLIQYMYLKSQGANKDQKSFVIVFDELLKHFVKHYEMFSIMNEMMRREKIIVVYVEQFIEKFPIEFSSIKHFFYMRQNTNLISVSDNIKKEIKGLNVGEICHVRKDCGDEDFRRIFKINSNDNNNIPNECIYFGVF